MEPPPACGAMEGLQYTAYVDGTGAAARRRSKERHGESGWGLHTVHVSRETRARTSGCCGIVTAAARLSTRSDVKATIRLGCKRLLGLAKRVGRYVCPVPSGPSAQCNFFLSARPAAACSCRQQGQFRMHFLLRLCTMKDSRPLDTSAARLTKSRSAGRGCDTVPFPAKGWTGRSSSVCRMCTRMIHTYIKLLIDTCGC